MIFANSGQIRLKPLPRSGAVKLPKTAVVVTVCRRGRYSLGGGKGAQGFKTSHAGDVLQARIGPITIDAEAVWQWGGWRPNRAAIPVRAGWLGTRRLKRAGFSNGAGSGRLQRRQIARLSPQGFISPGFRRDGSGSGDRTVGWDLQGCCGPPAVFQEQRSGCSKCRNLTTCRSFWRATAIICAGRPPVRLDAPGRH